MKEKIHPEYHKTKAECACGASYEIGSTKKTMEVEICSHCHPFYTGRAKLVDAAGRVEKFKAKLAKKAPAKSKKKK